MSPIPTVRANDVAFALHAVVLCSINFSQFFPRIWGFHVGRRQRVSVVMLSICGLAVLSIVTLIAFVASNPPSHGVDPAGWAWIDVAYAFGYLKLLITIIKYCPQVWVNYKRKSTDGFSIVTVLLDLYGGILSFLQLILDSAVLDDWAGVTGNPAKLGLAYITLGFDAIFITQHYW